MSSEPWVLPSVLKVKPRGATTRKRDTLSSSIVFYIVC